MKKLFIFMATVLLAFTVGCQTGTGSDAGKDSDTSKESAAFTYEVTEEGTICITGVKDESVSELVIPKKIDGKQVTEIGRYAFYGCENLKSVELTNVVKIGKGAFSGCVNLESVSMPKVETIKDKAFLDCAKLTKVELPEKVEIADNAFEGCDSLPVRMPTATPTPTSTPTPTPTPTLTPTPTPTPTPTVTPTPTAVPVDIAQFKNAKVGDTVVFGSYEQKVGSGSASYDKDYTAILDAAYSLEPGLCMDEPCTLSGVIHKIDTPWSEDYQNITVSITVNGVADKPIMCFRLKGDGAKKSCCW